MRQDLLRRLTRLEALTSPDLIAIDYLIDALPPMSAAVSARYEAWAKHAEVHGMPTIMPADPARDVTDDDLAEYVLRTIPHDMVVSADGCAALLTSAYFRRNKDRYGEDRAWRMMPDRGEIARRMEPRFRADREVRA